MLMSLTDLKAKYCLKINGVLHVGAHLGEEAEQYEQNQCGKVWWVEANPKLLSQLQANVEKYGHVVIPALVADKDDETLDFHITNNGMSSSILELGTHKNVAPHIWFVDQIRLQTSRLDTLVTQFEVVANFLCMDLQGAEMLALVGAPEFLQKVEYIFTEVNWDELYIGCARIGELDSFLSDFDRVETYAVDDLGWGDALYVRK